MDRDIGRRSRAFVTAQFTVGLALKKPAIVVGVAGATLIVMLIRKSRFEEQLLVERYPDYPRTWGIIPGM